MTNLDFLKEITPKAKITQIGFFTSDIFSAMKNWDELLGVDGWILYKHSDERIQNIVRRPGLCEEKFQFYAACAMLGNTQIELIQPLYGLPFYENFLREHGDGAHHMKLVVPAEHYDQVLPRADQLCARAAVSHLFFDHVGTVSDVLHVRPPFRVRRSSGRAAGPI